MRVVVPHVGPPPYGRVLGALSHYESRLIRTDDDRGYFDLLSELWSAGETLAIVEHDIVVNPDTLDELEACPHDWCSFPYAYMDRVTHGLGCVKFSADLLARNPDAMWRVAVMHDGKHRPRHWCRLDAFLTCVLESNGEVRHKHETMVQHLNPGCSHGCAI